MRATASSAQRSSTLGSQLDLLRAYLDLIALRMGPRLAWSIDAAPDLLDVSLPPMLLQPVVENAIKHGLEPKVAGGRVELHYETHDWESLSRVLYRLTHPRTYDDWAHEHAAYFRRVLEAA